MKNKIIKLEKERLVKQFPSQSGKNLRDEEPFFIIGKKDEDLKNWSIGREIFLLPLLPRHSTSRDGDRPGRNKLKKETDVLE
jgi:hypothetical protein